MLLRCDATEDSATALAIFRAAWEEFVLPDSSVVEMASNASWLDDEFCNFLSFEHPHRSQLADTSRNNKESLTVTFISSPWHELVNLI